MNIKLPDYRKIHAQRVKDLERLKEELEYYLENPRIETLDQMNYSIIDYYEEWIEVKK